MLRRLLVFLLVVSVVSLGLPTFAHAGNAKHEAMSQTMGHDCVCPPGHDMPASDQSDSCAPTLGCLMHCATAQPVASLDASVPPDPVPTLSALGAVISETIVSSSYPPFRPPSL
jgi:hypothetical protein